MLSQAEENYLKAILKLSQKNGKSVSTNAIAEELSTKASSVSDMMKKLSEKSWIHYVKYQGVSLTEKGRSYAVHIVRKHRLWEVFLVNQLNFKWDEVHDIAEQLEHIKSLELVNNKLHSGHVKNSSFYISTSNPILEGVRPNRSLTQNTLSVQIGIL